MQHWYNGVSFNQQWTFQFVSSSTSAATLIEEEPLVYEEARSNEDAKEESAGLQLYPSPATIELAIVLLEISAGEKVVNLLNGAGRIVLSAAFAGSKYVLKTEDAPAGMYIIKIMIGNKLMAEKTVMIKR
jgi:arabinan endo-1,5-alpha-L-arabinosidase